jgi:hypothetical protein
MDKQKVSILFYWEGRKGRKEGREVLREGRKEQRRLWTTAGDADHKFLIGRGSLQEKK